jgi:glycosyltransferase involved in cell wall biosynthesis
VVTSDISSTREIAGNGAILVDPYSVDSISEGIIEAIKQKDRLIKNGQNRVKAFSWVKTAKETLNIYDSFHS